MIKECLHGTVLHRIHYHTHCSNSQRRHLRCLSSVRELLVNFFYKKLCGLALCLPDTMENCHTFSFNSDCVLSSHLSGSGNTIQKQPIGFSDHMLTSLMLNYTEFTQTSSHRNISCHFFQELFCSCELASNCAGEGLRPTLPEVPCVLLGAMMLCNLKSIMAQIPSSSSCTFTKASLAVTSTCTALESFLITETPQQSFCVVRGNGYNLGWEVQVGY